jgi:hypothetical protein
VTSLNITPATGDSWPKVEQLGWRMAFGGLAAYCEVLLSGKFLRLALAEFPIAAVVVSLVVNVVPILVWSGLQRGQAASIAAMLGVASADHVSSFSSRRFSRYLDTRLGSRSRA